MECLKCGHVVTYPAPSASELTQIYEKNYRYDIHRLIEDEKTWRSRQLASLLNKVLPVGANKSVFEIGAMQGIFLGVLKQLGWSTSGIELDPASVKIASDKGINLRQSSITDWLTLGVKSEYDLVVLSHTLEHLTDLSSALAGIHSALKPNGHVALIVPNCRSTLVKVFGKCWGWWQVPIHLNHFSTVSLEYLCSEAGFTKTYTASVGGDSLMLLSSAMLLLKIAPGIKTNNTESVSKLTSAVIKLFSASMRYWRCIGNDELIFIGQKRA